MELSDDWYCCSNCPNKEHIPRIRYQLSSYMLHCINMNVYEYKDQYEFHLGGATGCIQRLRWSDPAGSIILLKFSILLFKNCLGFSSQNTPKPRFCWRIFIRRKVLHSHIQSFTHHKIIIANKIKTKICKHGRWRKLTNQPWIYYVHLIEQRHGWPERRETKKPKKNSKIATVKRKLNWSRPVNDERSPLWK